MSTINETLINIEKPSNGKLEGSFKERSIEPSGWPGWQLTLFRFFFLFFALQILPIDWKLYKHIFTTNWLDFHFYDLFVITKYLPEFISGDNLSKWGIASYVNWGIIALLAFFGTLAWNKLQPDKNEHNNLYYWLRAGLRYRLAIGIIAYGFIKLFPLQMPFPSLSNMHTNYGDFLPWKIYWHTIGITQGYESFLGAVEILAGLLLLNRKTVTFATGLIIGFTGNVLVANFSYDGGEHVYSSFLVLIATFLFIHDVPRLYNLLILEKKTLAEKFEPVFTKPLQNVRLAGKGLVAVFILVFGTSTYINYISDPYLIPGTPGLSGAYGFYNVKEFKLNNQTIPYSTTDPNRWQNVIFEKWATISIKIARPVKIDIGEASAKASFDIDRNYESAGIGGRHYFAYTADTVNQTLSLQNKNKHHRNEKLELSYSRPDSSTIIVKGINENKDSIYAVLERIDRKYMLYEGRRKPVKL
ncbi:MAG TPA: DoxX family protein [Cytophagaceae bacterium]